MILASNCKALKIFEIQAWIHKVISYVDFAKFYYLDNLLNNKNYVKINLYKSTVSTGCE